MRTRILLSVSMLLAVAALSGTGALPATSAPLDPVATAAGSAVSGTLGLELPVVADGDERAEAADVVSGPGVDIADAEVRAQATIHGVRASAQASVSATAVRLLDGLVTADAVTRRAVSKQGQTEFSGEVLGLSIDDQLVGDVADDRRMRLPDGGGSVTVNRAGRGLVIRLSRDTAGLPPGTLIIVGEVRALARDGAAPTPTPTPDRTTEGTTPTPTPDAKGDRARPDKAARERRREQAAARRLRATVERLSAEGFGFPVFGEASTADDFGAFRQIGAHQGNDVFAPFGAPVLAVADGTVEKVGTLPISGNRLWLRTDEGDTFFYAHLSAFAPAAVTGRRVTRGTLLGFVGNTGDAEPTPPHVHFEVHPGDGDAIDPHEVLAAWQARETAAPKGWLARYGTDTQERPGALVEVRDLIAGG